MSQRWVVKERKEGRERKERGKGGKYSFILRFFSPRKLYECVGMIFFPLLFAIVLDIKIRLRLNSLLIFFDNRYYIVLFFYDDRSLSER